MTDKVQKIREEVARMHNLLPVMDGDNISINYADRICRTLEMYIDSLQEEPVSRTTADVESAMQEVKEKSRAFTEAHKGESSDEILAQMRGEEPVSKDLKEAAWLYYDKNRLPIPPEWDLHKEFIDFFKAGAKWQNNNLWKDVQKELVIEDLEEVAFNYAESCKYDGGEKLLCVEHFKAGAVWQKEQLMKDAIPAELYSDGMFTPLIGVKDKEKLKGIKFGDKVKLIIIKNE